MNTVRASHPTSLQIISAPEKCNQALSLARGKEQTRVGTPLPGLVQAAGEPLGLHLVAVNEDPHPRINIEHGSIGTE